MIEVKNAVKRFDGFAALDGATLSVPAGSVYGLVGPNGAGKSTLIRHLTGIYRQDGGSVSIGGEPLQTIPIVAGEAVERITIPGIFSRLLRNLFMAG